MREIRHDVQWAGNCLGIKECVFFCGDMHGFQHMKIGSRDCYGAKIFTYMMIVLFCMEVGF